ncbi:MAG: pilin [Minisyncoccia bacterium]
MKNKFTKFLALSIFLFSLATLTHAQAQPYQLLVPSLPGIGAQQTTLTTYIPAAFRLAIGASAVLAFVMITFGGIMYATADAITQKQQGREYLTNAVVGLLLVIGAYAILYTIDPGILAIDLVMKRPPTATPPAGVVVGAAGTYTGARNPDGTLAGYSLTPEQVAINNTIRDALATSPGRVYVNAGPCDTGSTRGCTNVIGLPPNVVTSLKSISQTCLNKIKQDCLITITGGAEGGHLDHGPGANIVDLGNTAAFRSYLATIEPKASNPTNKLTVRLPTGATATFERAGAYTHSSGEHWHVTW